MQLNQYLIQAPLTDKKVVKTFSLRFLGTYESTTAGLPNERLSGSDVTSSHAPT